MHHFPNIFLMYRCYNLFALLLSSIILKLCKQREYIYRNDSIIWEGKVTYTHIVTQTKTVALAMQNILMSTCNVGFCLSTLTYVNVCGTSPLRPPLKLSGSVRNNEVTTLAEFRLCAPTTEFCPEPLGPPPITRRRHTSAHAHAARTTHVMTLFRARVQTACSYVVVWHRWTSSARHRYHVKALAHVVHARIVDVTNELSFLHALWRTINSNRTTTTTCPLVSLSCRNAILCDGRHFDC